MQFHIVYTFPFTFPRFPRGRVLLSKMQKGPDGNLGIAIDHRQDNYDAKEEYCSFFEMNIHEEHIFQSSMLLPYHGVLSNLHICYSPHHSAWSVALDALVYDRSADVYMIPKNVHAPWTKAFTTRNIEKEFDSSLVGFWQHEDCFPLIFSYVDSSGMYDLDTYWTHWETSQLHQLSLLSLNSNYQRRLYVCDDGCLLFTVQCLYDKVQSSPVYRKMGPGHWCFHVAAYEHTGTALLQGCIPNISMPVRDMQLAVRDFRWLVCSMAMADGPLYGGKKTCVAALVMQDHPELAQYYPFHSFDEPQTVQGGLYCIDMQGNIVNQDSSLSGVYTSLCSWHNHVIGITYEDGQWQLWRWYPFQQEAHTVDMLLSPSIRRATIIVQDEDEERSLWFWCVEEYENGVRVTQRMCDTFQEKKSLWVEGIMVPDNWTCIGGENAKPKGIVVYQESLIILGIDQEKHMQLLQFK